jgi:hypothetical protein
MRLNHSTTRSPRQQPHFPSATHEWPQLTDVRPGLPIPPPAAVSPAGIITARTGASIDAGAPVRAFGTRADRLTGHHGQESMTSTEDIDSDQLGGLDNP